MPTCPRCGSPRIDRYCSKCGSSVATSSTLPPPLPVALTPPAPRRSNLGGVLAFLAILGLGLLLFTLFTGVMVVPRAQIAAPAVMETSVPPIQPVREESSVQIRVLATDIAALTRDGVFAIPKIERLIVDLQARQSDLAAKSKDMVNLRFSLEHALTQSDENGHWPVRTAGRWFDRPALVTAIRRVSNYIHEQDALAERMSKALAALDRSVASVREASTQLRDIESTVSLHGRTLLAGGSVDISEVDALRARVTRLSTTLRAASANLPKPSTFTIPAFDLDPPPPSRQ